jgi:hypothetical protein
MFEKYKNVDKEDKEKIQHKGSYEIASIKCSRRDKLVYNIVVCEIAGLSYRYK